MPKREIRNLKVVVLGDGAVGKTCLLHRICQNWWPVDYIPQRHESFEATLWMDGGIDHRFVFWDTAGQDDYDRLRPLCYPETDIFIFCFASNNHESMERLKSKFIPEVQDHGFKEVPYLIVQTKVDLYEHQRKKESYDRMINEHPRLLTAWLSECDGKSDERWMPVDLFNLVLHFAEYSAGELDFDESMIHNLISEDEIDVWLKGDLKFGLWESEKRVPFIQTSALRGINAGGDSHPVLHALVNCMHPRMAKKSGCVIM